MIGLQLDFGDMIYQRDFTGRIVLLAHPDLPGFTATIKSLNHRLCFYGKSIWFNHEDGGGRGSFNKIL